LVDKYELKAKVNKPELRAKKDKELTVWFDFSRDFAPEDFNSPTEPKYKLGAKSS